MASYLDFCHDFIVMIYNFIDICSLIDKYSLPFCCCDDSQKCERNIMKTEEANRKQMKKSLI